MKKWLSIFLSSLMILTLTGCGSSSSESSKSDTSKASQSAKQKADTAVSKENSSSEEKDTNSTSDNKENAVVYFSATGNTKGIAEQIADILNADIYEIVPEETYTDDDLNYNDDNCRANKEMNDDSARPAIKNDLSPVTEYKTVYIGYPIWWSTAPRIIQTFLDTYDLSGKNVYTFCTSGGSDIDQSINDLNSMYSSVNIVSGKRFSSGDSKDTIKEWLDGLN